MLMSVLKKTGVFLFVSFTLSMTVHADTIFVPDDHTTIQAAIDAAINGDSIIIRDGKYRGRGNRDIQFRDKSIYVRS
ncbi:hypothetical protein K8T06_11825 [bacterium]|nr:hypothetical protein [bacterium]